MRQLDVRVASAHDEDLNVLARHIQCMQTRDAAILRRFLGLDETGARLAMQFLLDDPRLHIVHVYDTALCAGNDFYRAYMAHTRIVPVSVK
jgi:hypothetical protein